MWKSPSAVVATVSNSELVTFQKPGASDVTAVCSGRMGAVTVSVNPPPWDRTGNGDTVFDMPTYVSRVQVNGDRGARISDFIVRIGGPTVVNELASRS